MNRIILSAAAVFTVATVAHADEVSDIQAQSKELREHNRALTKRIADLERRGGVKYAVRPDLSVAYYHEEQNSFQSGAVNVGGVCTTSAFAQCSGQLDAVSFVADYRFAKRFDAYAGIMWSQVSNGLANGFLQRSSIDPTVGLRFQF